MVVKPIPGSVLLITRGPHGLKSVDRCDSVGGVVAMDVIFCALLVGLSKRTHSSCSGHTPCLILAHWCMKKLQQTGRQQGRVAIGKATLYLV